MSEVSTPEKKVGDLVVYTDKEGNTLVARVERVWSPPILNLRVKTTGELVTSVPCRSYVDRAIGFFWE